MVGALESAPWRPLGPLPGAASSLQPSLLTCSRPLQLLYHSQMATTQQVTLFSSIFKEFIRIIIQEVKVKKLMNKDYALCQSVTGSGSH